MRKTFVIAAFIVSFVLCNAVSAANYSIGYVEIEYRTWADNIPRTLISIAPIDLDDYYAPAIAVDVKSVTITDQNGLFVTYPFVTAPVPLPLETLSEKLKNMEIVRLDPGAFVEYRGIDVNQNGIIDLDLGEYQVRASSWWSYSIITKDFLNGGTYDVSVDTVNGPILTTVPEVPAGVLLPPVTDVNAKFDVSGRFNVSWTVPDVYLNNPEDYQNATIQIRVDRYTQDGNPRYCRFRVENLPLLLDGNILNNYTLLKYESDFLRLYTPSVKVQVRIILQNPPSIPYRGYTLGQSVGQSEWKEFKLSGSKVKGNK